VATAEPSGTLPSRGDQAQHYNRIKIRLMFADLVLTLCFLAILAFSGLSRRIAAVISSHATGDYAVFLLFLLAIGIAGSALSLPLDFYSGYLLEHRFHLSTQSLAGWVKERIKSAAVGISLGLPVALAFYYLLRMTGGLWWFYFGLTVFALTVLLARVAPVLIYPLFYKYTPVDDRELLEKLSGILDAHRVRFKGIYSFNMSKDTRKANAGFMGIGSGRRIVLSDTLLNGFTTDEIVVVFAHEVGHYLKRHIAKNILLSAMVIFGALFCCSQLYTATYTALGFAFSHDVAALPVLFFYLSLFSLAAIPLMNALSRGHEREADRMALELTGRVDSFVSAMEKLADRNLADRDPHPIIVSLFYSHPPIRDRIKFARSFGSAPRQESFPAK
jgi:STE24 endopeptidase